eukprot:1535646-Pyramimonas_sp.AAC.2
MVVSPRQTMTTEMDPVDMARKVEILSFAERCNVLCETGRRLQLHDAGEVRHDWPVQWVVRRVTALGQLPERTP